MCFEDWELGGDMLNLSNDSDGGSSWLSLQFLTISSPWYWYWIISTRLALQMNLLALMSRHYSVSLHHKSWRRWKLNTLASKYFPRTSWVKYFFETKYFPEANQNSMNFANCFIVLLRQCWCLPLIFKLTVLEMGSPTSLLAAQVYWPSSARLTREIVKLPLPIISRSSLLPPSPVTVKLLFCPAETW